MRGDRKYLYSMSTCSKATGKRTQAPGGSDPFVQRRALPPSSVGTLELKQPLLEGLSAPHAPVSSPWGEAAVHHICTWQVGEKRLQPQFLSRYRLRPAGRRHGLIATHRQGGSKKGPNGNSRAKQSQALILILFGPEQPMPRPWVLQC